MYEVADLQWADRVKLQAYMLTGAVFAGGRKSEAEVRHGSQHAAHTWAPGVRPC